MTASFQEREKIYSYSASRQESKFFDFELKINGYKDGSVYIGWNLVYTFYNHNIEIYSWIYGM